MFADHLRHAWFVGSLALAIVLGVRGPARAEEAAPIRHREPVVIRFDGVITPSLAAYLRRKLDLAKERGADLVIVQIDSPGGRLDASFACATWLRELDWARTVAYVPRQALSGAAIVALGCNEIVMGPDAVLGDAGPIYLDEGFQFRHAPEKIRTDLARRIRDLAEAHGRPPALAEAMVDMDLIVYRVKSRATGKETYLSDAEIQSSEKPDDWEKLQPVHESRPGHFLEVSGRRAVELHLVDGLAAGRQELLDRYHLVGEPIVLAYTTTDQVVDILNSRWVTGLLFVIGLVALYVEFCAPGIMLGGLTAMLCFGVFFWSHFLGGTAGLLEVFLFGAALVFLAAELFVLPGFGVAGLTGILLLLASFVLACQGAVMPRTPADWSGLAATLTVMVVSLVVFLGVAYVLGSRLGMIPLVNRLILQPPGATPAGGVSTPGGSAEVGPGLAVGAVGVALSLLRPAGKARFGGRQVDVVTCGDFIDPGRPVQVVEISGNRIVVAEAEPSA